jgi:hypothetical protein
MRFQSLSPLVMSLLAIAFSSHSARAERSNGNFPDPSPEQPAPIPQRLPRPPPARPTRPAAEIAAPAAESAVATQPSTSPAGALQHDEDARAAKRRREQWLLSLEAVTHAPIDMGVQLGLETPQGLRLFGGYGFVPGTYMGLLTGVAANASGNSYAAALLDQAKYQGHTWRIQAGLRPFRAIGLYGDFGYARLSAKGSLDLSSSGMPVLEALGGGYVATTNLDMWLVELGYQGELADRLVLGLALGCMGTLKSKTTIAAVDGAPTNNAILNSAASQADAALEKYGIVPTLTLRLGFDLI